MGGRLWADPRRPRTDLSFHRWLADGSPDVVVVDRTHLASADALDQLGAELVTLAQAHEAASRPVAALLIKPLKCARLHAHVVSQLAASATAAAPAACYHPALPLTGAVPAILRPNFP